MGTVLGNVIGIPTMVVTILLFGAVIRRLLGVRLGLLRTTLAAVLALFVAGPLLTAMLPDPEGSEPGTVLAYGLLAICVASLLAMSVLVIAEVVVPDGSVPGPIELWRGWRTRTSRARRYAQIVRIAARHGLGRFLRGQRHPGPRSAQARLELAHSLRRALDDAGVTFVKLGQQLSTRRDLVSAEFADELAGLQDKAAPIPWAGIEAVLAEELGRPPGEVFASIDAEPLAAASVAQVHAALLPDGTAVVVKVQRPGVARVVEADMDILARLAGTLQARTDWGASLGLVGLAGGFADALREELDFTTERDNLRAMAAALDSSSAEGLRVPTSHPRLSTKRVLVMDRLTGTPLAAAEPVLAALGADGRRTVAARLLGTVLDQVLDHGMFHVDLHPGNVLVDVDGSLGLLDFGSVGRLDGTTRIAVGQLMAALGRADALGAMDALLELVDRPEVVNERELERALGDLILRYAAPGATAGAAAFTALFRLVTLHRLRIPPQVAAVFRTFATLEGTLLFIDPTFDLIARARESGRDRVVQALGPERLQQVATAELTALLPVLRRLPRRLDRIAGALEDGRLSANVRLLADPRDRDLITGLVHQSLLAVLGAAAGVMAVLLLSNGGGPEVTESVDLFAVLGYGLLVVAFVLVLRVLVVILRRDPP